MRLTVTIHNFSKLCDDGIDGTNLYHHCVYHDCHTFIISAG